MTFSFWCQVAKGPCPVQASKSFLQSKELIPQYWVKCCPCLFICPPLGGPDQFSCQIQKFLVGSLALPGKKTRTSTRILNAPHLAWIGCHLSHGGGSTSWDVTSTKKSLCWHITRPLGSMLMQEFLFQCLFCCKTTPSPHFFCVWWCDNYIISTNVLLKGGQPPITIKGLPSPSQYPSRHTATFYPRGQGGCFVGWTKNINNALHASQHQRITCSPQPSHPCLSMLDNIDMSNASMPSKLMAMGGAVDGQKRLIIYLYCFY